jgi:serine/threonine-protein kinase
LAEARSEFERELLHESRLRDQPQEDQLLPAAHLNSLAYADFTLERLVGAGGMGKVYCAIDRRTGNPVAIKTLAKSRQRNRNVVQRFLQEAQILAKLAHPNIVAFHGIGRFPGGGYFMVMDYIEGTDLQARISRAPLPINEALRIFRQVADAVRHAHVSGIVHGDIKPANVLLNKSSETIVTDFGLAQLIDASPQNSSRLIGGTTGYIAPEVSTGHMPPTVASDIYGLGALLAALLIGRPPGIENPLSPTHSLAILCGKCMATNPADRYESIDDLFAQLVSES